MTSLEQMRDELNYIRDTSSLNFWGRGRGLPFHRRPVDVALRHVRGREVLLLAVLFVLAWLLLLLLILLLLCLSLLSLLLSSSILL